MKKTWSGVLAAVLLVGSFSGCGLSMKEVSSNLTTVVTQSRTPVEDITLYLPETAPAGLAQIVQAYSQHSGAQIENLSADSAALVYIEDYNDFLAADGAARFYDLSTYPSQTVLALCDNINDAYAIQDENGAHYALPVGLEGFGYMVNTRILGDIFEQELPEELLYDIADSTWAEWEALIQTLADYLAQPEEMEVTLNGVIYKTAPQLPESAAKVTGIFALPTQIPEGFTGKALNAVYNQAYHSFAQAKAGGQDLTQPLTAYAQAMNLETANLAGAEADIARGTSFSGEKAYNAEEAFALFAEETCIMLRQEGTAAHSLLQSNAALAARLAFLPIKIPEGDGTVNNSITVRSKGYWAINKNAPEEKIRQAVDFLAWYYLGAQGQTLTSGLMGLMSFNLLAPDTSIMGSTLYYVKNNRLLVDCATVMNPDAAVAGGQYLLDKMATAKWTEETYAGFAKSMQSLWQ